ncbi:hypothetical protein [Desulfonatronum lacustre]|uniref:hypothetical protein n=1 Tax=Desulfonatronum lacustre TaxID=66849 RepID=UPI0004913CF9|nr:hypothetical protein [Desulfonatronum lacustre]
MKTVITVDEWEKVMKASVPPEPYHAYREAILKPGTGFGKPIMYQMLKPLNDIWSGSNRIWLLIVRGPSRGAALVLPGRAQANETGEGAIAGEN